jgi:hypothetical protein
VGRVFSNRGLAIIALLACGVLSFGPWLRPAVSRDFRGIHIPWADPAGAWFVPKNVAQTPRPWLPGGVGGVLMAVVAVGLVVAATRPRSTGSVFGALLAISIAATAAAFWNHPTLMEFFEAEVRARAMLREVLQHQGEDLLAGGSPDRLGTPSRGTTTADSLSTLHPVILPFRYALYGPWVIAITLVGLILTTHGRWTHRLVSVSSWLLMGVLFAAAVTWPRWIAEYNWWRADVGETANRFADAESSLDQALVAMPQLEQTRRYWISRGRLAYRQGRIDDFSTFFIAHQNLLSGESPDARALLSGTLNASATTGEIVPRELLAEALGGLAVEGIERGDLAAAESAWRQAANLAPWMSAYWMGLAFAALETDPARAAEMEGSIEARLGQIGDRMVRSDMSSAIGDAYFNNGDFSKARAAYQRSLGDYNLPKNINVHAKQGRLGL